MSTHNVCFYGEMQKIIPKLSLNTSLSVLHFEQLQEVFRIVMKTHLYPFITQRMITFYAAPNRGHLMM